MRVLVIAALALALTACVETRTKTIRINENTWYLQTSGVGPGVQGQTRQVLINRAATLTLAHGFTHFKLGQLKTEGGYSFAGFTPQRTTTNKHGIPVVVGGEPVDKYQESSVVLVHMKHSSAGGALNAAKIVEQQKAEKKKVRKGKKKSS